MVVPMLAKDAPARREESAPQLRGRAIGDSEAAALGRFPAGNNVVPLPRRDGDDAGGLEAPEVGVQLACDRALCEPVALARAAAVVLAEQVGSAHVDRVRGVIGELEAVESALVDMREFMVSSAAGGLRVTRRRVDLKLLCERVLEPMQAAHPENVITFACDAPVDGQWDPEKVASLLTRLVTNAIRHGVAKRTIGVSLRDLTDFVVLEVTNCGPPLPGDLAGGPFEPFASARSRQGMGRRGLGLGLYLSREIVRAHGGRIEARSDGGRVTVTATLPRSCPWFRR
jgi:signal transduction histidine kinase